MVFAIFFTCARKNAPMAMVANRVRAKGGKVDKADIK